MICNVCFHCNATSSFIGASIICTNCFCIQYYFLKKINNEIQINGILQYFSPTINKEDMFDYNKSKHLNNIMSDITISDDNSIKINTILFKNQNKNTIRNLALNNFNKDSLHQIQKMLENCPNIDILD